MNSVDGEEDELEQMRNNEEEKSQWKISIEKIKEDYQAFETKSRYSNVKEVCICLPHKVKFLYFNIKGEIKMKAGASYENKPRMRICFDPEHEIPKLQAWFAENNHPSRLQVEEYVNTLNRLESRKGKKPLDINNVIYWFKNTRAAVKRAQAKHDRDRQMMDPFYFQKMPHLYEGSER